MELKDRMIGALEKAGKMDVPHLRMAMHAAGASVADTYNTLSDLVRTGKVFVCCGQYSVFKL